MSEVTDPQAWIKRAEEDYLIAQSAIRRKKPLTYIVCFHAQQCAEKYLKAILITQGKDFPKTHDLLMLETLCKQIGILVPVDAKQLNILSDHAIRTRYPGEDPILEECREALEIAKLVRKFVRKLLGIK
ncbi:MAG: HEPN domain-containing protein [Anaerolineales bacterium]